MERIRYKSWRPRGFIALISVIYLSSLLLLFMAAADTAAYVAHQAVTDEYAYRVAQQSAFSCARFAASRLDADPLRFYGAGTTTIQLTDDSYCHIQSASSSADQAGFAVLGESGESRVPLFITASRASSTTPFHLDTWTEY